LKLFSGQPLVLWKEPDGVPLRYLLGLGVVQQRGARDNINDSNLKLKISIDLRLKVEHMNTRGLSLLGRCQHR
jgi:hypothetical protein